MINIENDVFNQVSSKTREKYAGIYISGEYVHSPPSFPAVSLVEMDNSIYDLTQTSCETENHAHLMYEVNVYSNKVRGKKSECKEIIAFIDNEMLSIGFVRTMLQPVPNMDDATIYRMTARYAAVVSKNKTIYSRR